jgi:acyl-homoserine lactone synthase
LLFGIRQYTCVAHLAWLNQMLAVGWTCEPLGLPQFYNDEQIGAMVIHANIEGLELFRQRLGVYAQPLELPTLRQAA